MGKPTDDTIPPPLCVFCSTPWTDDMLEVFAKTELDHGFYPDDHARVVDADVSIKVTCSTCKRVVYVKEIRNVSNVEK